MRFTFWYYMCKSAPILILIGIVGKVLERSLPVFGIVSACAIAILVLLSLVGAGLGILFSLGRLRMKCPYCGRYGMCAARWALTGIPSAGGPREAAHAIAELKALDREAVRRLNEGLSDREYRNSPRGVSDYLAYTKACDAIMMLERGQAAPGLDLMGRLAEALNAPVADLLPTKAANPVPFQQQQARTRLESILKRADNSTLGILNAVLAMMDDNLARGH